MFAVKLTIKLIKSCTANNSNTNMFIKKKTEIA